MEYKELINTLKEIPLEDRLISITYDIWEKFDVIKNWSVYYLTIQKWHNKQSPDFIYKMILKEVWWYTQSMPKTLQLSWEQSLEALFFHYPYWYDNNSNCVLLNTDNKILGIQYNWLGKTTHIKTDCIYNPWYIVINNKKKIEWIYGIKDYNNLLPLLKKICAE